MKLIQDLTLQELQFAVAFVEGIPFNVPEPLTQEQMRQLTPGATLWEAFCSISGGVTFWDARSVTFRQIRPNGQVLFEDSDGHNCWSVIDMFHLTHEAASLEAVYNDRGGPEDFNVYSWEIGGPLLHREVVTHRMTLSSSEPDEVMAYYWSEDMQGHIARAGTPLVATMHLLLMRSLDSKHISETFYESIKKEIKAADARKG